MSERIAKATGVPAENIEVLAYNSDAPPPTVKKPATKAGAFKGVAGGIFSIGWGPIQGAIAQAAMDKRVSDARASSGYAAFGSEYEDGGRVVSAARYMMTPWAGEGYGLSDRFDMDTWRAFLRKQANSMVAGEKIAMVWEVQVGMKGGLWVDKVPDIRRVKTVYKKLRNGKWMDLMEGSDDWPSKARIKQPPNLNVIIGADHSDDDVRRHLGLDLNYGPADEA